MITITREQAQKIIDAADEVITALAGTNEDVHPDNSTKVVRLYDDLNDHYAPPEVVRELARIALASLEAEPAGYHVIIECGAVGCNVATLKEAEETRDLWNKSWTIKPYFYTAPPAPVVPMEITEDEQEDAASEGWADSFRGGWNACRAAMLEGDKS